MENCKINNLTYGINDKHQGEKQVFVDVGTMTLENANTKPNKKGVVHKQ